MARGSRVGQKRTTNNRIQRRRGNRKGLRDRRKQPNRRRQDYNNDPYNYNYGGYNYDDDYNGGYNYNGNYATTAESQNTNDPAYGNYYDNANDYNDDEELTEGQSGNGS